MSSELIILTLIVIIIVIVSRDWATAIIITLLLMNLIARDNTKNWLELIPDFTKVRSIEQKKTPTNQSSPKDTGHNADQSPARPITSGYNPALDIYGQFYEQWHAVHRGYTDCYADPQLNIMTSCSEKGLGVDAANTIMAQKRARDKKCSDGWAVKDKNYYAYGFADELDLEEKKRWWGNEEW